MTLARWSHVQTFVDSSDEQLDTFLERSTDGREYVRDAMERWRTRLREYELDPDDPGTLYTLMVGLDLIAQNVLQAEEEATEAGTSGISGPSHEDTLKIMHFIVHNGICLNALKRSTEGKGL